MSVSLDTGPRGPIRSSRDPFVNDFQDLFALGTGERESGSADPFGTKATFLDGEFDVLNELDVNVEVEQG
jgi:hypothetical protein